MLTFRTTAMFFDADDGTASGDEIEAEVTDAPVEGEEVAAPEPWSAPEGFGEKFTEWGVEVNDLDSAVGIYKALQTEAGVIDMVVEGLRSLGFGVKDIERILREDGATPAEATAAATAAPAADDDDEALLTKADVKRMLQQDVIIPQQEAQHRAVVSSAQAVIGSFFDSREIKDPQTQESVRALAKQYLQDGDWDPSHIAAALERGNADFEKVIETQAKAYLARKASDAEKLPTPVGGNVGGGEAEDKPDYAKLGIGALEAARKRVRARMTASGDLG